MVKVHGDASAVFGVACRRGLGARIRHGEAQVLCKVLFLMGVHR